MWDITSVCEVEARKHCSETLVCWNPLGLSSCSSIFQDRVSTSEPYCLCSYKRKFVQCIWQWHHIRPGKSWFRLKNIYSTRILCSLWTKTHYFPWNVSMNILFPLLFFVVADYNFSPAKFSSTMCRSSPVYSRKCHRPGLYSLFSSPISCHLGLVYSLIKLYTLPPLSIRCVCVC